MALSELDRAYIREVAINSAAEVSKQIIEEVLKWHIDACPHGKSIIASKWGLLGVFVGSGISGGGMVALVNKNIFRVIQRKANCKLVMKGVSRNG